MKPITIHLPRGTRDDIKRYTVLAYDQKTGLVIAKGWSVERVSARAKKTGRPFALMVGWPHGEFIGGAAKSAPLPDPRKLDEELAEALYARRGEFRELDEIQARSWELAATTVLGAA